MADFPPQSGKPQHNEQSRGVEQMLAGIQQAARARDFMRADQLHAELIATAPMALSEIIKASRTIEEAKSAGIDKAHLAMWHKLYDSLSEEERNCLYYSLKRYVLQPKTLILAHGAVNNRLFLLERGQVTIFFKKDGKNVILAQLGAGDILGEYTFSTISLCSASAITRTEVQLMCLESRHADAWEDRHPGLYEKLIDFCLKGGKVDEILRNKQLEKRRHERYPATGRVKATLLTADGTKANMAFGGSLADISLSGACLSIRCGQKAIARSLLDRQMLLHLAVDQDSQSVDLSLFAKVVRVSFLLYGDYSIHVRFSELQTEEVVSRFRV